MNNMDKLEQTVVESYENLQLEMKEKLIISDTEQWAQNIDEIKLIGGLDISYDKNDNSKACVTAVVLDASDNFKCLYENNTIISITTPYVAGFLAFREVEFLVNEYSTLKRSNFGLLPQVWLIDGNGRLHCRKFGLACHFGVLVDVPAIGVAKNPYYINTSDSNVKIQHKRELLKLKKVGDWMPIHSLDDEVIGAALKSTSESKNPVYVSIGNRVSLETAINIVLKCCKYKNPEPIRRADMISRKILRDK